jgi:CHAT domain-containing protein
MDTLAVFSSACHVPLVARHPLTLTLLAGLLAGCGDPKFRPGAHLMNEVRRAPVAGRATIGRLSIPVRYRECGDDCLSLPIEVPAAWADVSGKVADASQSGIDPDALQAAAVLNLVTGVRENSLDRSIRYLEMATHLQPFPDRYVDLSAALIERSRRADDAASSVAAVDAAARATELDSTNAAAHFNLAIALRDLGLYSAAREHFRRAAQLDPESGWAGESNESAAAIVIDTVIAPPDSALTAADMDAFARKHPNEARGIAWERLSAWGRAYEAKDMREAERQLALAEAAGKAIAESHVDPSVQDAVRAIRRSTRPIRLARAHQLFIQAQTAWRARNKGEAERSYLEAAKLGRGSPALVIWSAYGAGNNRLLFSDQAGAEAAMRRIVSDPEASRYPALAARAWWALGVVLLRNARFDEGLRAVLSSRDLYKRLGEDEYRAAMIMVAGEAATLGGDARTGYAYYAEALRLLRNYPLSLWRHNTLLLLSRAATTDGHLLAAELIEAEDDAASRAANRPTALIENQLTRFQRRRSAGDVAGARKALDEGRRLSPRLAAGVARQQLDAELAIAAAEVLADTGQAALSALNESVALFSRVQIFSKLLRAYVARADWHVRVGDPSAAEADLDSALSVYEQRRANVTDATQKSLLTLQARRVADALTLLRVRSGNVSGAWASRERARAAVRNGAVVMPAGTTLEILLIRDTLVTLLSRGGKVSARVTAVRQRNLLERIERVNAALERGSDEQVWRPLLEALYDDILAPAELDARDTVVTVIVDGALSGAPFAALGRKGSKRYVIDDHALRFSASLRQAAERRRLLTESPRAFLVADPAIDRRVFPALDSLRGARSEVDSIARGLPRARVVTGSDVDTARVRAAITEAEIFHFAGHAVFDDARPQASLLVIGKRGLTAQSIEQLRTPSLDLVVLSACETNRASVSSGAGFLGLTEAFISAGAGGVVGSTWKVDDAATRQLMLGFYRALHRTRDPVLALRDAQRAMRSTSPSGWAAFRYAGR